MTSEQRVHWTECYPVELQARMKECPIVYLPIGLSEPHGQIAAYGHIKTYWYSRNGASMAKSSNFAGGVENFSPSKGAASAN